MEFILGLFFCHPEPCEGSLNAVEQDFYPPPQILPFDRLRAGLGLRILSPLRQAQGSAYDQAQGRLAPLRCSQDDPKGDDPTKEDGSRRCNDYG
jgi:hypothetical protein